MSAGIAHVRIVLALGKTSMGIQNENWPFGGYPIGKVIVLKTVGPRQLQAEVVREGNAQCTKETA